MLAVWRTTRWRLIKLFVILNTLLAVSCASPPPAQVAERNQPPTRKILVHRVSPGETLYSIAWRYGLDFRQLARHNGIGSPYTIYASQQLRLDVNDSSKRKPPPAIASRQPVTSTPAPQPSASQTSRPKPPPKVARTPRSENKTPPATSQTSAPLPSGPVSWQWPARGRVLAGFSASNGLNKGIDIGGKLGEPVVAAAAGRVVYAGTGLRGYGKLVIVKHNETYLSAYAHNRVLQVQEGQSVKAGQQIAELGSSGTDKEKLHFEIRRDGKPVNPLTYLPKR